MADFSKPSSAEFTPMPADTYEIIIADVKEVPNTFYNASEDPDKKKTQFEFDLKVREEGEWKGKTRKYWTPAYFSTHSKNRTAGLCRIVDPNFDIERDPVYPSFEAFKAAVKDKPARIVVVDYVKKDGTPDTKIDGLLPSKLGDVDAAELLALVGNVESEPF